MVREGAILPLGMCILHRIQALLLGQLRALNPGEVRLDEGATAPGLVGAAVNSYRQLPLTLVEHGVSMAIHSFHASAQACDSAMRLLRSAVAQTLQTCRVPILAAQDAVDGSAVAYATLSAGEDMIMIDDKGEYAATLATARRTAGQATALVSSDPPKPLEAVYTPGLPSVVEVADFLGATPRDLLKTLIFRVLPPDGPWVFVAAVVRGDHEVSLPKLLHAVGRRFGIRQIALVDDQEMRRHFAIGFVGPDAAARHPGTVLVIDHDAAAPGPWITGGNRLDYHYRNFYWERECGEQVSAGADGSKSVVEDVRVAMEGDGSPAGGKLRPARGTILARLAASSPDPHLLIHDAGQGHSPVHMARAEIDLVRVLGAAAESCRDDRGLVLDAAIAPFAVVLTPIKYEGTARDVADRLYARLCNAGIACLLDDRDLRAGPKFADADLLGIPLRVNIGEKHLASGQVELKERRTGEPQLVPLDNVPAAIACSVLCSQSGMTRN